MNNQTQTGSNSFEEIFRRLEFLCLSLDRLTERMSEQRESTSKIREELKLISTQITDIHEKVVPKLEQNVRFGMCKATNSKNQFCQGPAGHLGNHKY